MPSEMDRWARAADPLGEGSRALWVKYLLANERTERREALTILDAFLTQVTAGDPQSLAFVEALAAMWLEPPEHWRERPPSALRYPLLCQLVVPVLSAGYRSGRPNHARWLSTALLGAPTPLRLDLPSPRALLEAARARDGADLIASRALLRILLLGLEYDMHDIPRGLHAAPEKVLDDLVYARQVATEIDQLDTIDEPRFAYWQAHAQAYPDYLANVAEWASFAAYIDAHELPPRPASD